MSTCLFCSKKLERKKRPCGQWESKIKFKERKFCNPRCKGDYTIKLFKEKPARIPANCIKCNEQIKLNRSSKEFCDRCYEKNRRIKNPEKYREWLNKKSKEKRDNARLKRGLPLNHPRLIANAGSGYIDSRGYRSILKKGHPNANNKQGRILEHVYVMSQYLSRPLRKGESVHHKNGIRDDNRIENLELWHKGQPAGQRVEDKIAWCKDFLSQYGYEYVEIATKRLDAAQCVSQKQMEMF